MQEKKLHWRELLSGLWALGFILQLLHARAFWFVLGKLCGYGVWVGDGGRKHVRRGKGGMGRRENGEDGICGEERIESFG